MKFDIRERLVCLVAICVLLFVMADGIEAVSAYSRVRAGSRHPGLAASRHGRTRRTARPFGLRLPSGSTSVAHIPSAIIRLLAGCCASTLGNRIAHLISKDLPGLSSLYSVERAAWATQ